MPNIIDSLLVSLGFKVEPEGLEKFAKHAEHIKHMVGAVFGFEVAKHIGEFVERTVESAAKVQDLAESYDIAATKMAAMGDVAVAHSSSLEAIAGAYGSVARMAGQAAAGIGRGKMLFKAYGLEAKDATGKTKSGMEILGDIADKLGQKSTTERLGMAGRLGIDPLLAKQMAEMGRKGFMEELAAAEKQGLLSEKDYATADATAIAFAKLHVTMQRFSALIAIQLGPTIQELVKEFGVWVQRNKELITQKTKETFEKLRDIVSKVIDVIRELAKHGTALKIVFGLLIAQKMGEKFGSWVKPMLELAGAMKKGSTVAEALKIGLAGIKNVIMGGLLAAIGLVVEDLWTFSQGGNSVTGWLLEKFPYAVEVAQGVIVALSAALIGLTTASGPLALLAVGLGGLAIAAIDLKNSWNPVMQWFGEQWDRVADKVRTFAKVVLWPVWAVAKLTGHVDDVFGKDKGANVPKTSAQLLAEGAATEAGAYKRPQPGLGVLDFDRGNMLSWGRGPLMAAAAAGGGNVTIHESVGPTTIQVNGAGDPKKVAVEVLREQERRAQFARSRTRDAQAAHR